MPKLCQGRHPGNTALIQGKQRLQPLIDVLAEQSSGNSENRTGGQELIYYNLE